MINTGKLETIGSSRLFQFSIFWLISLVAFYGSTNPVEFVLAFPFVDGNTSIKTFTIIYTGLHTLKFAFAYSPILFLSEKIQAWASGILTIVLFLYASDLYIRAFSAPAQYFR